eukprot:snap_masked-scaffold_66-processed-gene-0.42-mRNA-1 protein AED:1.00 eAED:1.00 QI:0/-1/0/0/-1/1/1/0/185
MENKKETHDSEGTWAKNALEADVFGRSTMKFRHCEREEEFVLDIRSAKLKNAVSFLFAFTAAWFLVVIILENKDAGTRLALNVSSIEEENVDKKAVGVLRSFLALVSPLFMGTFMSERGALFIITAISYHNNKVYIPLVDGRYVGIDEKINDLFTGFFFNDGLLYFALDGTLRLIWKEQRLTPQI